MGNSWYGNAPCNSLYKLSQCRAWLARHQELAQADDDHDENCLLCALATDVTRLVTLPHNEAFELALTSL